MGCFLPCARIRQSLGFLVEARYSTETVVEKKEL